MWSTHANGHQNPHSTAKRTCRIENESNTSTVKMVYRTHALPQLEKLWTPLLQLGLRLRYPRLIFPPLPSLHSAMKEVASKSSTGDRQRANVFLRPTVAACVTTPRIVNILDYFYCRTLTDCTCMYIFIYHRENGAHSSVSTRILIPDFCEEQTTQLWGCAW